MTMLEFAPGEHEYFEAIKAGEAGCVARWLRAGGSVEDPVYGVTAAMQAAFFGRLGVLMELSEAGADLWRKDANGDTAMDRLRPEHGAVEGKYFGKMASVAALSDLAARRAQCMVFFESLLERERLEGVASDGRASAPKASL